MKRKLLWFAGAQLALTAALYLVPGATVCAFAETYYLDSGSVTVTASDGKQYVTQVNGVTDELQTSDTVISQTDSATATANTIAVISGSGQTARVTLSGVNVDVSDAGKAAMSTSGEGDVIVTLTGQSVLKSGEQHAGLEKNSAGNLTITAKDTGQSLYAGGGSGGAGIGGGQRGSGAGISVSGGEVTAQGSVGGAGIGGGLRGDGDTTINCGGVTVSGHAKLRTQGGTRSQYSEGSGAPVGAGGGRTSGHAPIDGTEVTSDASGLTVCGRIECYEPGVDMETAAPTKTTAGTVGSHSLVPHDAKAPTCTENGWSTYSTCSQCDYTTYSELPATGHSFTAKKAEPTYLKSVATCTESAVYYTSCASCGESSEGTDDEATFEHGEPDAAAHGSLTHVAAKAATAKAEGNTEYWHCADCEKYFSDAAGTKEISKAATVIAKKSEPGKEEKKALPKTGDDATTQLGLLLAGGLHRPGRCHHCEEASRVTARPSKEEPLAHRTESTRSVR